MKQLRKPINLPALAVVFGCSALLLRRLLYALALDVRNLLTDSPLEIALWVLTAGVIVWVVASVWRLDGSNRYKDNFEPSLTAALGHYIAAAGILLTVLLPWYNIGKLVMLRRVLGILAAVGLILGGRNRKAGTRPLFLTHLAACVFLMVHMLGCVMAVLFAFYEAAFDAGMGKRRMQLATGLLTAYFGYGALSGSAYPMLYFGCAVWAVTDLCTLTPKPKKEEETP